MSSNTNNGPQFLKREHMSVPEWISVADNPIQRNTRLHAEKAQKTNLKEASPTHQVTSMARLPDGSQYKLDGHTRAYLWQVGRLAPYSDIVFVDVYFCSNMNDVIELYKKFDTPYQIENSMDKLHGAYRYYGFTPYSTLVNKGAITTAVALALNARGSSLNIYNEIAPFIRPLQIIDAADLNQPQFPSGILGACLITTFLNGERGFDFWTKYSQDEGIKQKGMKDAVQALYDEREKLRHSKSLTYASARDHNTVCGKAISAFNSYIAGRWYSSGLKTTDKSKYVESHVLPKVKKQSSQK